MTEPKSEGGLGFRDLLDFNLALLGKQLWRIQMRPDLLMSSMMRARYFPGKSVWEARQKGTESWCWRSLLSARGMLEEGMCIREFEEPDRASITRIPLSLGKQPDKVYWAKSNSGGYTVNSGYHQVKGIVPTNAVIREKSVKGDPMCKCCGESVETLEHMLFRCNSARAIWKVAPLSWEGLEVFDKSFWNWWEELRGASSRENGRDHITLTVNLLWQIWKARNDK
ncbi:uncharacterized protein [Coffea arabica]|uniref:Reverse transcriptase zinc-binding domain-containing protein n=1 Tax=Coffea arabica TaxID=13443 RepID=A0ABM4VPC8_COFAR